VSGVVIEKNVLGGQKIMAGEALYKVADLSDVWLEGEVFERDLPAVRVGTDVKAEFDALPGEVRTGRVSYLYPTLNPETRTARIRVALRNPRMQLKPGMYATIRIEGAAENAVSVPRSAVLSTGERTMVFVRRKDGMLEPREVKIGESTEDRTRIISGLTVGETVVASATFLVDAESNLSSSLGGMGDMPGMDIAKPSDKKE
jgi:Cu(I)/Ag(I) efflux system membrane fusion protein